MTLALLVFSAALIPASADTITRDSLVDELPAVVAFAVVFTPRDTLIDGMFLARPPQTTALARVQNKAPFALTWLLEGAAGYDRQRLLREFGSDTVAMRRAFLHSILADQAFTESVVRLAAPILAAHGTYVAGAPPLRRVALTRAQATALARRFFQVVLQRGDVGVTICAKPGLLRDRPLPRDDVVEAWFYSIVRPRSGSSALSDRALTLVRTLRAKAGPEFSKDELERRFWRKWQRDPALWTAIRRAHARTATWAPVTLTDNKPRRPRQQ